MKENSGRSTSVVVSWVVATVLRGVESADGEELLASDKASGCKKQARGTSRRCKANCFELFEWVSFNI